MIRLNHFTFTENSRVD